MIDFLEKKGTIRILLILFENQDKNYSKYELEKVSNLSKNTLDKRIKLLKNLKLVIDVEKVGPRERTEINLTSLGNEIANLLVQIKEKI